MPQVILNPAPAVSLPEALYSSVTHLILNTSEMEIICELPPESLNESSDLDTLASSIVLKGVRIIVITLGAAGAYFHSRLRVQKSQPGVRLPAQKVDVVDTTAAGDTFVGAYAVMMAQARGAVPNIEDFVETAVSVAIHASAKTVQTKGAQSSIPWFGELTELVTEGQGAATQD